METFDSPFAHKPTVPVRRPRRRSSPFASFGAAIRSTFVSLRRSGPLGFAQILCAAVALSLVGAALYVARGVDAATIRWRGGVDTIIFLDPDVTKARAEEIGASLEADRRIARVSFVSQQDAYAEFQVMFRADPTLVESVGPEALPSSWRVVPVEGLPEDDAAAIGAAWDGQPGVYQVVYAKDAVSSVLRVSQVVRAALWALAVTLVGVQLLLVFSACRSAAWARRDELAVMRLVGAPRWVVRLPFVAEGALCGLVGGAFAAVSTRVLARVVGDRVGDGTALAILAHFSVSDAEVWRIVVTVLAVGALVGAGASAAASGRYVRTGEGAPRGVAGRVRTLVARRRASRLAG